MRLSRLIITALLFFAACSTHEPQQPPVIILPRGEASAPVTIHQFSDFQCPPCAEAAKKMKGLVESEFRGKARLFFRHFPLDQHPWARGAARAAVAAGAQGRFWEMHDLIFANQRELGPRLYQRLAYELGLNVIQFENDLQHSRVETVIADDIAQGKGMGINATPTFVINGKMVAGNRPVDEFRKAIRDALKQSAR